MRSKRAPGGNPSAGWMRPAKEPLIPASAAMIVKPSPRPGVKSLLALPVMPRRIGRSEEHTSELQSRSDLVCRLLLEKKKGMGKKFLTIALLIVRYRFSE